MGSDSNREVTGPVPGRDPCVDRVQGEEAPSPNTEPERTWPQKIHPKPKPFCQMCVNRVCLFAFLFNAHFFELKKPWVLFLLETTEDLGQIVFRLHPMCSSHPVEKIMPVLREGSQCSGGPMVGWLVFCLFVFSN